MTDETQPTLEGPSNQPGAAPPPTKRKWSFKWFAVFAGLGGLFFILVGTMFGAVILDSLSTDMERQSALLIAAVLAVTLTWVLPSVLALRTKKVMSAARIYAGFNLVLILVLVGFFSTRTQRAVAHHGAWPAELLGQDWPAFESSAKLLADVLPGDEKFVPPGQAGEEADAGPVEPEPTGPLNPQQVFEKTSPSVVYVGVRKKFEKGTFEEKIAKSMGLRELEGHGSGFVVSPDGLIVTNAHVAGEASSILIRFKNGTKVHEVTRLVVLPHHDLALLKIDAQDLPPLTFHPAQDQGGDDVAVGSPATALGSPLGLDFTLTTGIVSAKRAVDETNFLQMQTTIAPGSSGGPVVDDRGQLVGVSTATRGAGLNLAVHVKHVRELLAAERKPDVLEPWSADIELVSLEFDGVDPLPTSREMTKQVMALLAKSAGGCVEKMPPDGGSVELNLKENAFGFIFGKKNKKKKRKKAAISNLGAKAERCMLPSLGLIGSQLAMSLKDAPEGARVTARFGGFEAGPDAGAEAGGMLTVVASLPKDG